MGEGMTIPVHPLGSRAKVLLTSVFGPYAKDDEYGSRAINPMELYQNQVTEKVRKMCRLVREHLPGATIVVGGHIANLPVVFPAALWAARRWFREGNPALCRKLAALLDEVKQEIGLKARLAASLGGRLVLSKIRKEDRRLKAGWTCEPPTFYEMNERMWRAGAPAALIRWVAPETAVL